MVASGTAVNVIVVLYAEMMYQWFWVKSVLETIYDAISCCTECNTWTRVQIYTKAEFQDKGSD